MWQQGGAWQQQKGAWQQQRKREGETGCVATTKEDGAWQQKRRAWQQERTYTHTQTYLLGVVNDASVETKLCARANHRSHYGEHEYKGQSLPLVPPMLNGVGVDLVFSSRG